MENLESNFKWKKQVKILKNFQQHFQGYQILLKDRNIQIKTYFLISFRKTKYSCLNNLKPYC